MKLFARFDCSKFPLIALAFCHLLVPVWNDLNTNTGRKNAFESQLLTGKHLRTLGILVMHSRQCNINFFRFIQSQTI